jgi:hypothetical protein
MLSALASLTSIVRDTQGLATMEETSSLIRLKTSLEIALYMLIA